MPIRRPTFESQRTLVEFLDQIEDHSEDAKLLVPLSSDKIIKSHPEFKALLQLDYGRSLFYLHSPKEAEKYLRALTEGDQRLVIFPLQRAAAILMSKIEMERHNVDQASIWMRLAVIGTLVDKSAGSEEIIDTLTEYGAYLTQVRQLSEAQALFWRLLPLYNSLFPPHSPKRIRYMSSFINLLSSAGNFGGVEVIAKDLRANVADLDIIAPSVKSSLFFEDLYQSVRTPSPQGSTSVVARLKSVIAENPGYLKNDNARIIFTYFALLSGDIALATEFDSAGDAVNSSDLQIKAYDFAIKALIAAWHGEFDQSIALCRSAVGTLREFHRAFESEGSSRLPQISIEERTVLGLVLALDSPHVSNYDQANTLFELGQFLNRDKVKLGLNENAARRELKFDLQREDIRTRDRLDDLRDNIMREATESLLARAMRYRPYQHVNNNDYGYLLRLQNIEDKIDSANKELRGNLPQASLSTGNLVELEAIQKYIKVDEALVVHDVVSDVGLVTICIEHDKWTFNFNPIAPNNLKALNIDEKLLFAAVHNPNEPSSELDASIPNWPAASANHLYTLFFGHIEECIKGKDRVLLATDADFFALPWNALLTALPQDKEFHFRDAAWLPKSYAISLLPSVRSLYQLRSNLPKAASREKFLGIGDPDFHGTDRSAQLALGPLFTSRGVANRTAIAALPALPELADELVSVAKALGASPDDLLLRDHASERELRRRPLNDYRVISFATHAIVAGEIEGVTEPALVLSPVASGEIPDDGLLTASKISNLELDANLVILSACNTGGSDGHANGRGLSGLADAFFFAGARAVAVTQWSVFSSAAEQIGEGMISRSIKPGASGVSDGLREAMLDYIANAREDYLANPQFWGAFIIAGDGAVGPLDGDDVAASRRSEGITTVWDHFAPESSDADLLGVARSTDDNSFLGVGIERPPAGEKRAGSYLARIAFDGNVTVIKRDSELGAREILSLEGETGVLGYFPHTDHSSAVFRVFNANQTLKWEFVQDSDMWAFPIDIIRYGDEYILISIENENEYTVIPTQSQLNVILMSDNGAVLLRHKQQLSMHPTAFSSKGVLVNSEGNLVVAIGGEPWASPTDPTSVWTNPDTGTRRLCSSPEETQILEINPLTLLIDQKKTITGISIIRIQNYEGRVLAAGYSSVNCHLEKQISIVILDSDYDSHQLYQSRNVNALNVSDMVTKQDGSIILVGTTRIFLPTTLTVATKTLDELKHAVSDPWGDSFWESGEEHGAAFVFVLNNAGQLLGDRVFPDLRNRGFAAITADFAADSFVAVGSASGEQGWAAKLHIGATYPSPPH